MRKVAVGALVVIACVLSTTTIGAAGSHASSSGQQLAVVTYPDAPLTVVPDGIDDSETPAVVRFTVTNDADARIRHYDVRAFAFRANGRPMGFRGTRRQASLAHGAQHVDLVSLPEGMALESHGVVLIALTSVTFEDGHRWQAPDDAIERAKAEALRLAGLTERR